MQELFFWLGGLRWDSLCAYVFIFVTEKSIKNENIAERQKKPNLTELTQILCDLLSLLSKHF